MSSAPAVGAVAATQTAATPPVTAAVGFRDVGFGGPDAPFPAGPWVRRITNAGERARQMVRFRTPRPVTAAETQEAIAGPMTGTPPPADPLWTQLVWIGYAAIIPPDQTVWTEYDLEPGSYVATSWVIDDPATGEPALAKGMVQPFTVG